MFVTNTSGAYILLPGCTLPPGVEVFIDNDTYVGDKELRDRINSLYSQDRVYLNDPDGELTFPVIDTDDLDEIPSNFYVDPHSLEVHNGEGLAILGTEENANGHYGILELHADDGSYVKISTSTDEEDEAFVHVNHLSVVEDELGSVVLVEVNGMPIFRIANDGKIGFNGVDPIAPPELDAASATAEDVANALISLGLSVAP